MSKFDDVYLNLCEEIMEKGELCPNRTGTDTKKLTHVSFSFNLQEEFPILTSKFVGYKGAILEMLWIFQMQSNDVRELQKRGVTIWDQWQIDPKGYYQGKYFGIEHAHTIGTAYGWIVNKYQLVQKLIEKIKTNPDDRRMIINLWQDEYIETASLPSCVWNSQWDVTADTLNCLVTVRSNDVPLGMPYNVTQYAVLLSMIAHVTGLKAGKLTFSINNAHIYVDQFDGIREQLKRRDECLPAPKLWLNPEIKDFFDFDNSKELKDVKLIDYKHLGKISMPVSV